MQRDELEKLLRAVQRKRLGVGEAVERLARLDTADLGFARIDHHRSVRRGAPEVVFGPGKSREQLVRIVSHLARRGETVLVTKLDPVIGEELRNRFPRGIWSATGRAFLIPRRGRAPKPTPGLLIVSAGTADLSVAEEAAVTAEALGMAPERLYDVGVAGIHRLLEETDRLRRAKVIIVVAGMEGALPSVVAGLVDAPVIGTPTSVGYGAALGGLTALLGMLTSCAGGVTVVNIDNGFGAAVAARLILGVRSARRARRG